MRRLFMWFFNKFLLKTYLSQQNKPVTHKDLDYAFTDTKGVRYYQFTMNQAVPMNRLEKLKTYIGFMEMRLSPESLDLIVDKAVSYIEAGLKEKNNAARCAALLLELKERSERIVPAELIYNYLAVLYIREDEDPMVVDSDTHLNKVTMFMQECARKDSFFFHLKELRKLFDSLTLSHDEWQAYLDRSSLQGRKLLEKIKVYSTGT